MSYESYGYRTIYITIMTAETTIKLYSRSTRSLICLLNDQPRICVPGCFLVGPPENKSDLAPVASLGAASLRIVIQS